MGTTSEALRIYRRARHVRREGFHRYRGKPEEICRSVIRDAYDGYFRTSNGHFCEFYVRDFAWCCSPLVSLGYREEVARTVAYALNNFVRAGRIGTMITPGGEVYDFPTYGPDSLALFLLTLDRTKSEELVREHRAFLQAEVDRFVKLVVDRSTWLPRTGNFSSMRDHARRRQSCYDMAMICLVAKGCERFNLRFPKKSEELRRLLVSTYWNGTYFFSDMAKQGIVLGDANVVPFWAGVVADRAMEESALTSIRAAGLDDPFPLRYVSTLDKVRESVRWHPIKLLMPDYETDSIWAHLGMMYLELLARHDRRLFRRHVEAYARLVERHGTFLEVYEASGAPYQTAVYVTDEAMLWCAMYLRVSGGIRGARTS